MLRHLYHRATVLATDMGATGLPVMAAWHARRVAEELDDPAFLGWAAWLRLTATASGDRERAYDLAVESARELESHLADRRRQETYGAPHLYASLFQTANGRPWSDRR